jgi:Uma2 family endonuclease
MTQAVLAKKKYTYEDYLKTPENERYELIGGELVMTPPPKTDHQSVSAELQFRIMKFVKENGLGRVFDAPYDVYLDEETVLQPDLLFISKDRQNIIGEDNVKGAPDLVIEILSESTAYRDTIQKKILYAKFGVKEYWIVAPKEAVIELYTLKDREYALAGTFRKDKTIESRVLAGLKIDLQDIF